MSRRDARAPRRPEGRTLGFDRLEDRWVQSGFGLPSPPPLLWANLAALPVLAARSPASFSLVSAGSNIGTITAGTSAPLFGGIAVALDPAPDGASALAPIDAAPNLGAPRGLPSIPMPPTAINVAITTAMQAGGLAAGSTMLSGALAVPPPFPLSSAPGAMMTSTAGLARGALGMFPPGAIVLVMNLDGAFIETITMSGMLVNGVGEVMTGVSTSTVALPPPGGFLLGPLVSASFSGSARASTNGANSPVTAPTMSIAAVLLGTGNGIQSPCVALKSSVYLGVSPLFDRSLSDTGPAIGRLAAYRDFAEPINPAALGMATHDSLPAIEPGAAMPVRATAIPLPERLDLIISFTPFDEAALAQKIDGFLRQVQDLSGGFSGPDGSKLLIAELVAAALALAVWKTVRRFLGHSRAAAPPVDDTVTSFEQITGLSSATFAEEP